MKNYKVHEIVTTCYTYQVFAHDEGEAIERIRHNHEEGHIPESDVVIDIKYSAGDASVISRKNSKFLKPTVRALACK